jgi:hypothetical protein
LLPNRFDVALRHGSFRGVRLVLLKLVHGLSGMMWVR